MNSDHPGDSHSVCNDFSIAEVFQCSSNLTPLWNWFNDLEIEVWTGTGTELFATIDGVEIDTMEKEAFLIGLLLNNAATRTTSGGSLRNSQYKIRIKKAITVLYQQLVATQVIDQQTQPNRDNTLSVETLATVPSGIEISDLRNTRIGPLAPRLRSMLLEAQESVRIANPYFDSGQQILNDVVALPRKGVETKILTRETDRPEHRTVLNEIHDDLSHEQRQNLNVRELYEIDEAGYQTAATHAKIIVADDTVAYVGSANFTATSLRSNFELGVLLHGPPVEDVSGVFDIVYQCSKEVQMPID